MIEENILRFGYSDISVRADIMTNTISFKQITTELECDTISSKDVNYTDNIINIRINDFDEYYEFYKCLKEVNKRNITQFTFKDYVFNFNNYNEKSIIVIEKNLTKAALTIILSNGA